MRYVVSINGTFGVEERRFITESGIEMVVIRWGPLGWRTPVPSSEIIHLKSAYESEARVEAHLILAKTHPVPVTHKGVRCETHVALDRGASKDY
jgi:hypothetical protein